MQKTPAGVNPEYAGIIAEQLTRAFFPGKEAAADFMAACMIDAASEIPTMTTADRNRLFVERAFRAGAEAMFRTLAPVIDPDSLPGPGPGAE